MSDLRMTHLRAILPRVDAADAAFMAALDAAMTNEDVTTAEAAYRVVLEAAVNALYEDTRHVNRLESLRHIHLGTAANPNRYPFGVNPPGELRAIVRRNEGLSHDVPIETT